MSYKSSHHHFIIPVCNSSRVHGLYTGWIRASLLQHTYSSPQDSDSGKSQSPKSEPHIHPFWLGQVSSSQIFQIDCEVDTGASCNILPLYKAKALFGEDLKLGNPTMNLKGYNDSPVKNPWILHCAPLPLNVWCSWSSSPWESVQDMMHAKFGAFSTKLTFDENTQCPFSAEPFNCGSYGYVPKVRNTKKNVQKCQVNSLHEWRWFACWENLWCPLCSVVAMLCFKVFPDVHLYVDVSVRHCEPKIISITQITLK